MTAGLMTPVFFLALWGPQKAMTMHVTKIPMSEKTKPLETCTQRRPGKAVDTCAGLIPKNLAHLVTPEARSLFESKTAGYANAVRKKECNEKCRTNVQDIPDLVSKKYKFMWHNVPRAMSFSLMKALRSCPELEVGSYVPADVTQEELRSYTYVGMVRDPLERFLSGYEQFWVDTLRYTNNISKRDLQACFNAHDKNRRGPKHCENVAFHGVHGATRNLRMNPETVIDDAEYKMIRNLAFSEFYDYPLDLTAEKTLKDVLRAISLMAHGCNCWAEGGPCRVYVAQGNFMPVQQHTTRSFDFALRVEHAAEDYQAFLQTIGVQEGKCPPLVLVNETVGGANVRSMVDTSKVRKAIETVPELRRGICEMYMPDSLCMGYESMWRDLCEDAWSLRSWGETVRP